MAYTFLWLGAIDGISAVADEFEDQIAEGGFALPPLDTTNQRTGTKCVGRSSGGWAVRKNLPSIESEFFAAAAFKNVTLSFGCFEWMYDNNRLGYLFCNSDGSFSAYRGSTLLGTTSPGLVSTGSYNHIAIRVLIHNSAGSVTVYLNKTAVLTLTGIDTQESSFTHCNQVRFGVQNFTMKGYIDDFYVSSGSTFPGDCRIMQSTLASAGTYQDFTASSGTHLSCVDDLPPNTTDYVSTATTGHKESYLLSALGASGTVKGIQVSAYAATDTGSRSIKTGIKHSASESYGTAEGLNTSYQQRARTILQVDPSTSVAFVDSDVASLEVVVEVTA